MSRTLLACLLVLAAFTRGQAHGGYLTTASSVHQLAADAHLLPAGEGRPAQDTTKLGALRGGGLASARGRGLAQAPRAEAVAAQPDSLAAALPSETATFEPEAANLPTELAIALRRPEAPLGRRLYRTRLVRTGRFTTRPEAVEILTCTSAGPLVLAQLPATNAAPAQVLAGPGYDAAVPLRPLPLTQEAVLHLCGARAPQVQAYARLYNLHFQQADEVARLLDYYNRIAVVKE